MFPKILNNITLEGHVNVLHFYQELQAFYKTFVEENNANVINKSILFIFSRYKHERKKEFNNTTIYSMYVRMYLKDFKD